jgi:hypothetical protein
MKETVEQRFDVIELSIEELKDSLDSALELTSAINIKFSCLEYAIRSLVTESGFKIPEAKEIVFYAQTFERYVNINNH